MGEGVVVNDCPTVAELGKEFRQYKQFNDPELGFDADGVRALGKDVYGLMGRYAIKGKGKFGRLYLIADRSKPPSDYAGTMITAIQNAIVAGNIEIFMDKGANQVDIACTYRLD